MLAPKRTINWVKVKGSDTRLAPKLLEDNGDGTYTLWDYSAWGPIGIAGKLMPGVEVVPLSTKADREAAARMERLMGMALQSQEAQYQAMTVLRGDQQCPTT